MVRDALAWPDNDVVAIFPSGEFTRDALTQRCDALRDELEVVRGPWYRPSRIQIVDEIPDRDASGAYDKQKLRERAEAIMAQ